MLENSSIRQRIYPNKSQVKLLALFFGHCRFVWNYFLELKKKEYEENKKSLGYLECSQTLTKLKKEEKHLWLNQISSISLQQTLKMLSLAFQRFFKKQSKYPNFKKKHFKQSFRLTKNGFKLEDGKLYIAKSKFPVKVRWSKKLPSDPSSITITKDSADRYFVAFVCTEEFTKLPENNKKVGIDLGLTNWMADSDSKTIPRMNYTKKYSKLLTYWQKKFKLKKKEPDSTD